MHIIPLRKVGGCVMLAAPPGVLHLCARAEAGLAVDMGRLVAEPKARAAALSG